MAAFSAPRLEATGTLAIDSLAPLEAPTNACLRFYDSCLFLRSAQDDKVYGYNLPARRSRFMRRNSVDRAIYTMTADGHYAYLDQQGHRIVLNVRGKDTVAFLPPRASIDRYLAADGKGGLYYMDWGPPGTADLVVAEVRSGKDFMPLRRLDAATLRQDTIRIPVVDRENLKHTYNRSRTINANGHGLLLTTYAHSDTVTIYDHSRRRYRKLALPISPALFYRDLDADRMMRDAEYNAGLNANSMWVANSSFSLDGAWFTVIVGRPETRPSHVTDYELMLIDTALTTAYKGIVTDTLGRTPFRHFVMDDMLYVQRQHSAYARSYGRFMMEAFPIRQQGRKFALNPGPWLSVPR